MNIQQPIRKTLLLAVGGVFVWWAWKSPAQDVSSANASLQMPYSVNQVLELEQAKIGYATIIAYIKSSGTSFNLNAAQIIYLRQQGLSDAVITSMLTQPRQSMAAASVQATAPVPQIAPATPAATSAATTSDPAIISQPPVTYVQTAPASYYPASYNYGYSYPYYPSYGYYGYYGWPVGWAWYGGVWRWGWGGGWHGGWSGGWHGGGWHR